MKSNVKVIGLIAVALICVGAFLFIQKPNSDVTTDAVANVESSETVSASSELKSEMTKTMSTHSNGKHDAAMQETRAAIQQAAMPDPRIRSDQVESAFSLSNALSDRALGDPNAPVRIEEFASLSCSHCATFHRTTFKELLKNEINTGRVYFIYNDLPTSASALDASQFARCVDEKHYFKLIDILFKNQDDWAFDPQYKQKLKQMGLLLGLSEAEFNSCMNNKDLRDGLLQSIDNKTEGYDIKSTPTFIINGKDVVSGGQKYDHFKKLIDKHINTAK
jgi:protein-disulfide isomerase